MLKRRGKNCVIFTIYKCEVFYWSWQSELGFTQNEIATFRFPLLGSKSHLISRLHIANTWDLKLSTKYITFALQILIVKSSQVLNVSNCDSLDGKAADFDLAGLGSNPAISSNLKLQLELYNTFLVNKHGHRPQTCRACIQSSCTPLIGRWGMSLRYPKK